jgi:hypothetical protein
MFNVSNPKMASRLYPPVSDVHHPVFVALEKKGKAQNRFIIRCGNTLPLHRAIDKHAYQLLWNIITNNHVTSPELGCPC